MHMEDFSRRHAMWIAKSMSRTDQSPLTAADIMTLEGICSPERVDAGTVLMSAGSTARAVYIVREGKIHLATRSKTSGRQTVDIVDAGGVIGDTQVLTGQPAQFDAYADIESTVLVIGRDDFLRALAESPSLSLRWSTSMAQRVTQSHRRLVTMLTKDLASQIATILLDHRVKEDDAWVVGMPHQTIANLLGARRQSVSRVLGQMRREGLVRSRYGSVEILDLDGIAELAGDDKPTTWAESA
jgi:CRP-like cAMP-binding protein